MSGNGKDEETVSAGVPVTNGGAGAGRAHFRIAGPGVRANDGQHPQLGQAADRDGGRHADGLTSPERERSCAACGVRSAVVTTDAI